MDEERACLVCMRVDAPYADVVTGSSEDTCGDCAAPVWVSPSGRAFAASRDVTLLCVWCALKAAKPDTPMIAVPGAMAELEAEMTPEDYMVTRVLMAMVGIDEEGSSRPRQPHDPNSNDIQKGNDDNDTHP